MTNLAGIHEPEQAAAALWGDKPGTVVFAVAIGSNPNDKSGGDWHWWVERGFRVLVRLNNGWKPDGTIPAPSLYESFAQRCANYVAVSQGCAEWIIGNEPNHEQERPQGRTITPAQYAACFSRCREEIKRVQPQARVIVAGPAPWNEQNGDWLEYWRATLLAVQGLGRKDCGADGLALHAYTHGADPALIDSPQRVNGWLWHFRTFEEQLAVVPPYMRDLPVDITETNQGDDPWLDANSGWVQRAVRNVDEWNRQPDTQKIFSVCLYRWPRYDTKYSIADKHGVQEDFRLACALGLNAPKAESAIEATQTENLFMPSISTGGDNTAELPPRNYDQRLKERGVTIDVTATHDLAPGQKFWRATNIQWLDEQQSQGRHHIYGNVRRDGVLQAGVPLKVKWPGDEKVVRTEDKSRDYPPFNYWYNYQMSPSFNGFSVQVDDGTPSEIVEGIGMGANGNSHAHTSTVVEWELVTMPTASTPPQPPVEQPQPGRVPMLVHPVADPRYRVVTQPFGVNGDYYKRFAVDGVPLQGHNGIDFGTPEGTEIVAADDGTVIEHAYDQGGYGEYLKLRHVWGESLYAHLSNAYFALPGLHVRRGQAVGESGNTGKSTGPHLHFGMRINPYNRQDGWGGYVDPAPYLIDSGMPAESPISNHDIVKAICAAALEFGVDSDLLLSLAWAESSFRPNAKSSQGAQGLFQIMPATWAEWGPKAGAADPFGVTDSARVGTAYFAWLLTAVKGNTYDAIVAYNAGIGNVLHDGPIGRETYEYANKIIHGRDLLKAVGA